MQNQAPSPRAIRPHAGDADCSYPLCYPIPQARQGQCSLKLRAFFSRELTGEDSPGAGPVRGDDGETFVVGGDDLYAAACELAEQVGIDLEDG